MCDNLRLKINIWKSKVLVVKNYQRESCEEVRVSREEIEEADKFNYMEVMINTSGGMGEEIAHSGLEGRKAWEKMNRTN